MAPVKIVALIALLPLAAAASAQASDSERAARIEVDMANYKYVPSTIALHHGRPYVLVFVNESGGGHNFVAKRFFAASTIAPPGRARLGEGEVNLKGHETTEISLVAPPPGTYDVHCSHFMHTTLGMKGEIVVD